MPTPSPSLNIRCVEARADGDTKKAIDSAIAAKRALKFTIALLLFQATVNLQESSAHDYACENYK